MNKGKLKAYAPQARRDFIAAVTARANQLGLSAQEILPAERKGDVTLIAGRSWPASIHAQREMLIKRIRKEGFDHVMEAAAYLWFNRFAALRYMEIHDYLGHGYRLLSNPAGGLPEILQHAQEVDLPGLKKPEILQLQLAGNKDGEIYRQLLLAQCNALHKAMPFLFEKIEDETELLLPDNLLLTDSVVADLVNEIAENDWQQVEIIGWLYQFYISERKDEVIGKIVASEDIPAATQLFTPNWIVKYLVQNSVGRLWLQANPSSTLASEWAYYIRPAGQSPAVQAEIDSVIHARISEDGDTLNPETITVLDPACGSGHILVEAYDLLKSIYLERGYRAREIPRLILEKNLYGLDIDDRAAQLAGFSLLMKARADDRRIFEGTTALNVMALQSSEEIDGQTLTAALMQAAIHCEGGPAIPSVQLFGVNELNTHHSSGLTKDDFLELLQCFSHAKVFGSLISIPNELKSKLPKMALLVNQVIALGDDLSRSYALQVLREYLSPACILSGSYDAIIANPPYMGSKGMNAELKGYAKSQFEPYKSDLFAMFTAKAIDDAKPGGTIALMTPFVWMFLSSYEDLRKRILNNCDISTLVRPEYHSFFESAFVPICAFVLQKGIAPGAQIGTFFDLGEFYGYDIQSEKLLEAIANPEVTWRREVSCADFRKIPGWAIAYWLSRNALGAFQYLPALSEKYEFRQGLATGANDKFLRYWHECDFGGIGFGLRASPEAKASGKRWFPCHKGGESRRWYGNHYFVVDWENDGEKLKDFPGAVIRNPSYYFREGATWGSLTVSSLTMRYSPPGFIFESKGAVAFPKIGESLSLLLAIANSKVMDHYLKVLAPTMDYSQGPLGKVPLMEFSDQSVDEIVTAAISLAKLSWDAYEISWDFQSNPLLAFDGEMTLSKAWEAWRNQVQVRIRDMAALEERNNRLVINAYGLGGELSFTVPEEEVSIGRPDRQKDMQRLISYIIGCVMGRYSIDEPGLIYASQGNSGFDQSRYASFAADTDGIVPVTDELWFEDDGINRIREFSIKVWGVEKINENLAWLAESLGVKSAEVPEESIGRYLADGFYKDHLQTYKKRPIYWLFSSGKHRAFQALVYLHRYNEGTLARMRSEYVVPLTGKMQARIAVLEQDRDGAGSTAARNKIAKQIESLRKKHLELLGFDEKLRHYADMRIKLDLDDGVKVNYGKFGDLLDSVKAITGGSDE